ncbi:hypothetical protein EIP91_008187, partial [Steccherinum ochraceum]
HIPYSTLWSALILLMADDNPTSSEGHLPPIPPTEFASKRNDDGLPVLDTIDWDRVVHEESDRVTSWMLYLHRRRDHQVVPFIIAAASGMAISPGLAPERWPAYRKSGLMTVCMDILMEPATFAAGLEDEPLPAIQYAHSVFALLSACIRIMMDSDDNPEDARCSLELFDRREHFFKFLWEKRWLGSTERVESGGEKRATFFSTVAQTSITWLIRIFVRYHNHVPPLSVYAAHSLLYHWVACKPDPFTVDGIHVLFTLMNEDKAGIPAFVNSYLNDIQNPAYPKYLFAQFCSQLIAMADPAPNQDAYKVFWVCATFLLQRMDLFAQFETSDLDGLFASLLASYHRQICSPSPRDTRSISASVKVILPVLRAMIHYAPEAVNEKIKTYAGPLDFISILGSALVIVIKDKLTDDFDTVLDLFKRVQAPLVASRIRDGDARLSPAYAYLLYTTKRIWHDTLRDIHATRPKGAAQWKLKDASIAAWRDHGAFFGLKEGVRVTTAKRPSDPSEVTRDLLTTGLVCCELYNIIKTSLDLQYNIELAADGMIDGPRGSGSLSTAQRLELLLDRRQRWRTLNWTRQVTVPVMGSCQAYELVGGMFAKSMGQGAGGSRHLITTWLPSRTKSARSTVREDLGVPTRDFAIDPSQDLIALVNVDDRVHLRTISTNTPHKGAAKAELQTPVPFQIGNCFIQIVQDVVGMFFWLHGPGLIVWNWRTGEALVACLPDGRPLGVHAVLLRQPAITAELHPGTWDFAFLSNRAYFLTVIGGRGSIEIYTINDASEDGLSGSIHVASLLLPETKADVEMHNFSTHSSPFLGGDVANGRPFAASQENRIHLMAFHYGQQGPRYHLFVKNDFLLSFTKKYTGQRQVYMWEEWGPDNTRFLEHNVQFQWLRYVHGLRVVLPPIPSHIPGHTGHGTGGSPLCRVCILDFNVHPKRIDDPCPIGYERGANPTFEISDETSMIPAGEIFEHNVMSRLPFSVASRTGRFMYSGFLIDEERLIGMKLSMAFAEGDLSDIDVFTF